MTVEQEFGGDEIFEGAAYAFEDSDFFRALSSRFLPTEKFVQVGNDVVAGDGAFLHGDEQVSGFGERGVSLDQDAGGALDGGGVDFAGMGLEGAKKIEVRAGTEVASIEERGGIRSAGAEDVGFGGAGTSVGRVDDEGAKNSRTGRCNDGPIYGTSSAN